MSGTQSQYRLTYFDFKGIAEPIRWIFHYTGTPFIDHRIPWDFVAWFKEEKQKYANTVGRLPVFYEEGKPELSQSHVISRYLAKQFGLVGDNDWENARVDEVVSIVYDLVVYWRSNVIFEPDAERRKIQRPYVDTRFELCYGKWNAMLVESGGPYIVGKKLTHADFWLASTVSSWDNPMVGDGPIMGPGLPLPSQADLYLNLAAKFPALKAHKERVCALPQIKHWMETRHKTLL